MQYYGTGRLGTTVNVAYTSTAGTTTAISTQVQRVRVLATTDVWIAIDSAPTATSTGAYLAGLIPEYFTVSSGQKVSAVQVASAGTLYVTEII